MNCEHKRTKIWEPHLAGTRKCLDCGLVYNPSIGGWYDEKLRKLRRLAEEVRDLPKDLRQEERMMSYLSFHSECSPSTVLELIERIEKLERTPDKESAPRSDLARLYGETIGFLKVVAAQLNCPDRTVTVAKELITRYETEAKRLTDQRSGEREVVA